MAQPGGGQQLQPAHVKVQHQLSPTGPLRRWLAAPPIARNSRQHNPLRQRQRLSGFLPRYRRCRRALVHKPGLKRIAVRRHRL
jgi:hypothetical protein